MQDNNDAGHCAPSALVERLRKMPNFWANGSRWMMATEPAPLGQEAADEIERLQHDISRHVAIATEQAGEIERLMKAPEDTLSEHPGCVYCMESGTPVKAGEVCPKCGDRSPTRTVIQLWQEMTVLTARLQSAEELLGRQPQHWDIAAHFAKYKD